MTMNDRSTPDTRTGRRTVLGMFAFGLVMVGLLWTYWELYTRPFRPLQNAIAAAYPGSRPSVIGGQHKSHQPGSPRILRIVLQMPENDFNPVTETGQREERAVHLVRLAKKTVDLTAYDEIEVHLVQRLPEQPQRLWSISRPVSEWAEKIGQPSP